MTGQLVLPSSIRNLSFSWAANPFSIGRYSAVATIVDGQGDTLTSHEVSFWIVPVWYIAGFIIILVLIYLLIRFIRKHVRISMVK